MKRRIIEIDDDDVKRIVDTNGLVTHECNGRIKDILKRSTVIGEDYKMPPYTKGLYDALEKVKERRYSEGLLRFSKDNDKHIYADILLGDIEEQIKKIISTECEKENKKAFAKWAKEHSNDS